MRGTFGAAVQRFAFGLLRRGLVHAVASYAYDTERRPPDLLAGFHTAESRVSGLSTMMGWLTRDAPAAILAGDPLPERPTPPPLSRPRFGLRRRLAARRGDRASLVR